MWKIDSGHEVIDKHDVHPMSYLVSMGDNDSLEELTGCSNFTYAQALGKGNRIKVYYLSSTREILNRLCMYSLNIFVNSTKYRMGTITGISKKVNMKYNFTLWTITMMQFIYIIHKTHMIFWRMKEN
ncbi:hypothetical protein RND81_01G061600 [Saponaria officinalis]|uniref:Uncharacterized protein n=1 Tax=Saponaria officinalis TaxID=3572 RepID=A0AAW1NBY8_SAPOF